MAFKQYENNKGHNDFDDRPVIMRSTRKGHTEGNLYELMVDPSGNVRTIYFHYNLCPPMLDIEGAIAKVDGKPTAMLRPRIIPKYAAEGWVYLEDLYAAEDRMEDWETFSRVWSQQVDGRRLKALPDEYLPDEVLQRRAKAEKPVEIAVPPPQRKTKQSAAEDTDNGEAKPRRTGR